MDEIMDRDGWRAMEGLIEAGWEIGEAGVVGERMQILDS